MRQGLLSVSTHWGIIYYLINISFIFLLSKGSLEKYFLIIKANNCSKKTILIHLFKVYYDMVKNIFILE
jgi:hypothetical protein